MNKFQLFIWRTCVVLVILSISFAFIKVTGAIIKFSREEPGSSVYTAQEPATPPAKSAKCIALTFDDGPHPDFTLKILSVLERHETKATFFVVGKMVVKHEGLLRAIHEYGHDIGTHTFNHPMLTSLSSEAVADELEKGRSTINILT